MLSLALISSQAYDSSYAGSAALIAQYSNSYNDDEDYDYRTPPVSRKKQRSPAPPSSGKSYFQNQKQIGASLLGFGLMFTVMGMMLFFEGNLLRLGNVNSRPFKTSLPPFL